VAAFLDVEPGRDADPCAERINLAAGMAQEGDRVGMVPGGEQGARAVQNGLARPGDQYLTVTAGLEPAFA
jgi:hypothetical protein